MDKIVAIFSDNDPYVPLSNINLFREKIGAKIIKEKNKGHYIENEILEIPILLKEFINMSNS